MVFPLSQILPTSRDPELPVMDQDTSYPAGDGQYGLDQSESPWSMYSTQYGQQNEQFGHPQNAPPTAVNPPNYQPYSDSRQSYAGYGNHQESLYPMPSYSNGYPVPYQESSALNPYALPHHGPIQSQARPQIQQSFQTGNQPYSYFQTFRADDRTISPHVLERVDNIPQLQRSAQTWNHDVTAGYEHQKASNSNEAHGQQPASRSQAGDYTSSGVGDFGDLSRTGPVSSLARDVSRTTVSRRGTTNSPHSTLRITHPELLAATQNTPSRRITSAPFIVLDEIPVELESGIKAKTSVNKSMKDSSKRSLDTGSENLGASVTSSANSTNSRVRPLKSGPSTGKVNSSIKQEDQKDSSSLTFKRDKFANPLSLSEEGSASDYSSSSEQSVDPEMQEKITDVRGETRPTDVIEAAAWDAIGTVYVSKWRNASTDEIIKGTQEFGKYFLNLRDELVSISTDLANAEAEKRLDDAKRLRDARTLKRNVIASAVQATIKFGKGTIVNNFGKSPKLINAFVNVLRDCVKFKDLDGEVPSAVLNLLSRCGFITDELLQKAKFEPLEKRFLNNNDTKIKGYIESIRANTLDAKERVKNDDQAAKKPEDNQNRLAAQDTVRAQKAEESVKPISSFTGLKRTLDTDANSGKPNKKFASEATAVGHSQKPAVPKPRPANFFDNLKRPGAKSLIASKVANPPAPMKKPESKTQPVSTPQLSLAEILASIEKPKEVQKAPEAPPRPFETPEEKARRERKESRRHLRVHWKDGNALAEIRLFRHEQAEDEGRQDNLLRDANDGRSEGLMLKQQILEKMADDEDDGAGEVEYMPYPEITLINFSEINKDIREKSFVTRGGQLSINTPQQQIQDRRESLELMVVYTDPKDIPSSPKEPPQTITDKAPVERIFGQPSALWLDQRLREIKQYGHASGTPNFVRRFEDQRARTAYHDTARGPSAPRDINSILNAIKGLAPQQQITATHQLDHRQHLANQQAATQNFTLTHNHQIHQPPQQPSQYISAPVRTEHQMNTANDLFNDLLRVTSSIHGKRHPPIEPPEWMTERGKLEWWEGYLRDNPPPAKSQALDAGISGHHAQLRAAQAQTAQMAPAPQMQYPQIGSYAAPPPSQMATGVVPSFDTGPLQQLLVRLNNPQSNSVPPHLQNNPLPSQLQNILTGLNIQSNQTLPQQQQNWIGGWAGASGGNNSGQGYPSQPQTSHWDSGWSNSNVSENTRSAYNLNPRSTYDNMNEDNGNHRARDGGYGGEDRHRSNSSGEYKGKKKPCKFWQEGKCAKGANCTFLHE